jgi:hypothetical protein
MAYSSYLWWEGDVKKFTVSQHNPGSLTPTVWHFETEQEAMTYARNRVQADERPFALFIVSENLYSFEKEETIKTEVIEARIAPR